MESQKLANEGKLVMKIEGEGVRLMIEAKSKDLLELVTPMSLAVIKHIQWIQRTGSPLPDFELMALALDIAADNLNAKTDSSKKFILDNLLQWAEECMEQSTPEEVREMVDRIVALFQFEPEDSRCLKS
jgi:hypothetical protein